MLLPALLILGACSKPFADLPELDFSDTAFDNVHVRATDARVTSVETDALCPDGEPSRIYAVHRTSWSDPRPTAVILHSAAIDYVDAPTEQEPFAGAGYHADPRLSRSWSVAKVWETLGLPARTVDPEEMHSGALAAALIDAGIGVVTPANCWGDLWHNVSGEQENDVESEFFVRNGLGLALATVQSLTNADIASQTGISVPIQIDQDALYFVGLGEGGRGVSELLHRDDVARPSAVLVDSSPDLLSVWTTDPNRWPAENKAIERIFGSDGLAAVDEVSLHAAIEADIAPDRTGVVWSSINPRLPNAMIMATADAASALPEAWVLDAESAGHIQLNDNPDLASAAALWLLNGSSEEAPTDAE